MKKFWRYYTTIFSRQERKRFLQISILRAIGGLMEMLAVYVMLPFISAIMDHGSILDYRFFQYINAVLGFDDSNTLIAVASVLIAMLYLVKNVYGYFVQKLQYRYVAVKKGAMSGRIFKILMDRPYSYHVKTNSASIQQYAIRDTEVAYGTVNAVFTVVTNAITILLIIGSLFSADPILTFIAIGFVIAAIVVVNQFIMRRVKKAGEMNRYYYAEQVKWINQAIGGLKGIYANRRQALFVKEYTDSSVKWCGYLGDYQIANELPRKVIETICLAGIFLIAAAVVYSGGNVGKVLPVFATFAFAAYRMIPLANMLNEQYNMIKYNEASLDSIYGILKDLGSVDGHTGMDDVRPLAETEALKKGILVDHIDFKFEDSDEYLYKDFSLMVPANKSVAFVGTTGTGKTTLIDIILGLQQIEKGSVLADGVDIRKEPEWWGDRIGYVPQMIYLCDDTIKANVAFAVPQADTDSGRVRECLAKAQLLDYIDTLPDGIDTVVGENGIRLSGGQRQRIGIARALYNDPPVLIMDEATSSLDYETEAAIVSAINQFAGKKTLLIIAHRMSTIEGCDMIYRIENGEATVEKGKEYL